MDGGPNDLALAIDIGGTKMAVGLVTRRGDLVDRESVATDRDKRANDLFDSLAVIIRRQMQRAVERHGSRIVTVGIGSAGPIERDCVTVSPVNIHAWRRFPLHEAVVDVVAESGEKLPVYGDLDAKAFALAEGWLGAARGESNFIGMVVSTGVGGGVVIDGQLLDGASGNAGHIGHVIVAPDGHRCGCGARGCLEAEASGTAIEAITGRSPEDCVSAASSGLDSLLLDDARIAVTSGGCRKFGFPGATGKEVQDCVEQYLSSARNLWPFVQRVSVTGPFETMPRCVRLVDIPGLNDPDPGRDRVAREHLQQAGLVWLVLSAKRAATGEIVRYLTESRLLTRLQLPSPRHAHSMRRENVPFSSKRYKMLLHTCQSCLSPMSCYPR